MTRDEAITIIKRGLGYRSDKTDEIIAALVEAQTELEQGNSLPWFLLAEDQDITLSAGTATFSLPSNFIRESEDRGLESFYFADSTHLEKISYDLGVAKYQNADWQTTPVAYALRKDSLVFFPTPSADLTMQWTYYAKADSLATATENVWLDNFPYLLIAMAGQNVAGNVRDVAAAAKFTNSLQRWQRIYFNELTAREDANQSYALGAAL